MRSKVVFLLSLVMATITTFLLINYMQQTDVKGQTGPVMADVIVAKDVISENQRITREMVEVKKMVKEDIHPKTVTSLEEIDGKFATTKIDQGEVILAHRLKAEEEEAQVVSRKIKEGYRAVSIGVNIVQSVTNLIEPEDTVDVLFTETLKDESIKTKQILTNVRVLAVGRKITTPQPDDTYVEYSSVTLELIPDDARKLVEASEKGTIHLTLNSSLIP
ncbi:Flp pilus assembly protein CpaB [Aquibacillus salsiterrae]|uniref:Flp pilus assembly protein CpaB n=1 Tax=Aquibacillus salsiterrae TaxID=2950439 RepID=A0A9X3WBZ6_9BACI|nr:Flp pilus assembly protein CpaB [Aquibacillus salsiterrae]MDC3416942.1 Flp pilus assembly protein CpaB [Aquibacillus salsiterrae]